MELRIADEPTGVGRLLVLADLPAGTVAVLAGLVALGWAASRSEAVGRIVLRWTANGSEVVL